MARVKAHRRTNGTYHHITQKELVLRTELRVCIEQGIDKFHYPCRECHGGGRRMSIAAIREHLRKNFRDQHLMLSQVGGDPPAGYPTGGVWVDEAGHEWIFEDDNEEENFVIPGNGTKDFSNIFHDASDQFMDREHNIQQQLYDAFDVGDDLLAETGQQQCNNEDGLEHLYEQAGTPVWGNSTTSVISATIVLMNMAVIHRCSNAFMDELFRYLSTSLLPGNNKLPRGHYEAKKLIRKLELAYDVIHTCPSGCVLYWNEHADLSECPKQSCKKSRYIRRFHYF
jgi:hypothetical protein